jgi:hypothetical protein
MIKRKHTWREKRLAREEYGSSKDTDIEQSSGDDNMDVNMVLSCQLNFEHLMLMQQNWHWELKLRRSRNLRN